MHQDISYIVVPQLEDEIVYISIYTVISLPTWDLTAYRRDWLIGAWATPFRYKKICAYYMYALISG